MPGVVLMLLTMPLIAQLSGPDLPPSAIPAERYAMRYVTPPPGITFMIRTYEPPADRHYFIKTVLPQSSQLVPRLHPLLAPLRLERDAEIRPHLAFFANPAAYRWGERVRLSYRDSYAQGGETAQLSLRRTEVVEKADMSGNQLLTHSER